MTRKEQILNKARELGQQYFPDSANIWARPNIESAYVENACVEMAEWADRHPCWIPVDDYEKDELPPLKDKEDQYGCSVSVIFVVNLDGIQYDNKGCFDYDTGVWHSIDTGLSYTKEQVTHWMSLPQLPGKEDKPCQ